MNKFLCFFVQIIEEDVSATVEVTISSAPVAPEDRSGATQTVNVVEALDDEEKPAEFIPATDVTPATEFDPVAFEAIAAKVVVASVVEPFADVVFEEPGKAEMTAHLVDTQLPDETFEDKTVVPSTLDDNEDSIQGDWENIALPPAMAQCFQTTSRNEVFDIKRQNYAQTDCIGFMTQAECKKYFEFALPEDLDESLDSYEFEVEFKETSPIVVAVPAELPDVMAQEYEILQRFDEMAYVRNMEAFTCPLCATLIAPSMGIVLRECIHEFCTKCLVKYITTVDNITVKCPYKSDAYNCNEFVQQRDLRAILPELSFSALLEKSLMVRKLV